MLLKQNSHTPRTRDDVLKLATDAGIISQENFSPDELSNILASIYFPEQKRRVMVRKIKSVLIRRTAGAVCQK